MRLPMKARSRASLFTLVALGGVLLSACAGDSTAPLATTPVSSQEQTSPFVPTEAQTALIGVVDGTYQITIDPRRNQYFVLGANLLSLPANSVCDLSSSGYGTATWDLPCDPETRRVTINAVVRDAATDHPRIDFHPAMRFNPTKNVMLYLYVPVGIEDFAKKWVIEYCGNSTPCVNEALSDPSLKTRVDTKHSIVFRRIKHFSGYIVLNVFGDALAEVF